MSEKKFKPRKGQTRRTKVQRDQREELKGNNDVSWYTRATGAFKTAFDLSYANVQGLAVDLLPSYPSDGELEKVLPAIPNVMVLDYVPVLGVSEGGYDPLNVLSNSLYAFVRHKNSGSRNYEAPDYATYVYAMCSLYAFYAEMCRLYGLTNVYSQTNRAINYGLITALGYDYDSVVQDRVKLLFYINEFALKLNTFCVPKQMAIYDRSAFLPLHVYKDADNDKCSFYAFRPASFYKWSATAETTGSSLQPVAWSMTATGKTVDNIIAFGNSLIDELMSNEDIGIMSGDTLKAFGLENLRTVSALDTNYATLPVHDQEILYQIHNAYPIPVDLETTKVVQVNGQLTSLPGIVSTTADVNFGLKHFVPLIDSGWTTPTPEYNAIASRFIVTMDSTGSLVKDCGSEIITKIHIFGQYPGRNGASYSNSIGAEYPFITVDNDTINIAQLKFNTYKTYFDWSPMLYVFRKNNELVSMFPLGEVFNYAVLSKEDIHRMHTAALMSLLEVSGTNNII